MHGKFRKQLALPDSGDMEVGGPFTPDGDERDEVIVHFLIVQGGEDRNAPADQTVTVVGRGSWSPGQDEWVGKASPKGRLPKGGSGVLRPGRARGIGLAVAVKPEGLTKDTPAKFDAPSYETLTWCADFELLGTRQGADQQPVEVGAIGA